MTVLFDIHTVARRMHALVETALQSSGLNAVEFAVYSTLLARSRQTPSELASDSSMPASTLSVLLQRMEERGHLVRDTNPADARSSLVSLSEEGRLAHKAASPAFRTVMHPLRERLGPDLELVRWALFRLESELRVMAGEPPSPFGGDRPDLQAVQYAGPPLTPSQEAEVRSFIGYLQQRPSPSVE